jgi:aspartyl-tRNA(Asn)/glutamyl-tRNA(Gln) amidotransferase subunit A
VISPDVVRAVAREANLALDEARVERLCAEFARIDRLATSLDAGNADGHAGIRAEASASAASLQERGRAGSTQVAWAADGPAAGIDVPDDGPASARAIAYTVRAGRMSAEDVVRMALRRAASDPHHALVHVDEHAALAQARGVDPRGALAGVPIVLKDNLADDGQPLTCASRALFGHTASYTATAVARLRAHGAVVIGRANMDELAMGSSTEFSAYGATSNPRAPGRAPGGSSGGSAAAVAAGIVPLALGSDTGGSVRQPAALCGVVGVKPSYGRISRHGMVAMAGSLDALSPFAACVRDAALVTQLMAGADPADATSLSAPVPDLLSACERGVRGLRIGVLESLDGVEEGVLSAILRGADALRAAGATLVPVRLPSLSQALPIYAILSAAEVASNLARIDGVRFGARAPDVWPVGATDAVMAARTAGLGVEAQRRVLVGTYVQRAQGGTLYARARAAAARLRAQLDVLFTDVDVLYSPTSPTVAFPLGARAADPVAMALSDLLTVPANLAGLPAVSVPCGTSEGLPVGAHLMGRFLDEPTVFAAAAVLEDAQRSAVRRA